MQTGNDLGEKMKNAFSEIFGMGYEKAIIIGSDMFDLNQKDLETAFDALAKQPICDWPRNRWRLLFVRNEGAKF